MPTYEYECRSCAYCFEQVQSMSDEPIKECPKCGKELRRIIFGGTGVIFKGSGFYINDSRGKSSSSSIGESHASAESANTTKSTKQHDNAASGANSTEGKSAGSNSAESKSAGSNSAESKKASA